MTSIAEPHFPKHHRGVERLGAALTALSDLVTQLRRLWTRILQAHERRAAERMRRAMDERTWSVAQQDSRAMSDLRCAYVRAESQAEAKGEPPPQWPFEQLPTNSARSRQLFHGSHVSWLEVNPIA